MLHCHKKSRHNLYEQLDYLGLNPYEQRHFCFGGAGSGASGADGSMGDGPEGGTDDSAGEFGGGITAGTPDAPEAPEGSSRGDPRDFGFNTRDARESQEQSDKEQAARDVAIALAEQKDWKDALMKGSIEPLDPELDPAFGWDITDYSKKWRPPRIPYTYELLADPVIDVLPKLDSLIDRDTAEEFTANYLDMLKVAGIEAAEEKNTGLMETIQTQLDKGLMADYYQDYRPMNELEKAGYKTFGTGYRGEFEARTGAENQSVTRDQYDPNTITGAGTGSRSEKISLFNQFALENPTMTAMEAMAAFNNIGSFGTISAVDLGMLGYSPDSRVGPQAESNEAQRERGFSQGLGILGQVLVGGPMSTVRIAEKIAFSGTPNTSLFGEALAGLNNATKEDGVGIVDKVDSVYNSFTNTLEEARDAVVDAVQENVFDPVANFFSPEQEAPITSPEGYNPAITYGTLESEQRAQEIAQEAYDRTKAELSSPQMQSVMGLDAIEAAALDARYDALPAAREETETAPGTVAADQMSEALQNAAYYDSLMNPEAISPPEPSSFFTGLNPKETQDYIDRVTTPEGVKLIRQRQAGQEVPPPTLDDQFSSTETKNFFPGSFGQSTGTSRTTTQTLADLYGISEDEANRMLGIA